MHVGKNTFATLASLVWLAVATAGNADAEPLKQHPANPHYLEFRGKPTVLIASGEHYGAVLNGDFDYEKYLDEVAARRLNLTRVFSGLYREIPGSFNIIENTLAPQPASFVCPWARTDIAGSAANGNKFDLAKFDDKYFKRLKDFVAQAGRRGIVIEFVLFSAIYDDVLWNANPQNPANMVNQVGASSRSEVYTLKNKVLVDLQHKFVRKIVAELREADNVYYEVCNEPYFGGVSKEWNDSIVDVIRAAEGAAPGHLIAQNISNGSQKAEKIHPAVEIFNFHYSTPPDSVAQNYDAKRVIGDDETGFKGNEDIHYRAEAWDFLLAGGAIHSNLDYSFSARHPDGSLKVTTSPGGGGPALRDQLAILKRFMEEMNFVKMAPDHSLIVGGVPDKATARALVEPGRVYAIYVRGGAKANLELKLPPGSYSAEWIDTRTGKSAKSEKFDHQAGNKTLASPEYREDVALKIRAKYKAGE